MAVLHGEATPTKLLYEVLLRFDLVGYTKMIMH